MSDDALSMVLAALIRPEGNLTKVQDDLTALRGDQTSLRVDTMARLDRHENHLTSIRNDIPRKLLRDFAGVAMGGTDHVRRISDNTREDVRGLAEQLETMWRKVNRLEEVVRGLSDRAGEGGKA